MPDKKIEAKEITIQGIVFNVNQPYQTGHAVSEAEAKALNQTRAENIRNNCAKLVKEAKTEHGNELPDEVLTSLAMAVKEKDDAYIFTLASIGGGRASRDPVDIEATKIAKAAINGKLRELNKKVSDIDKDAYAAKVAEIAASDAVQKVAKKAVAERNKLASDALENLDFG